MLSTLDALDAAMPRFFRLVFLILAICLTLLPGCATYSTVSAAGPGSPKIYSGTRLDLHAAQGDKHAVEKFRVAPPEHPLWDLPFSILLDTVVLPLSLSVSGYEFIFGSD